MVIIYTVDGTLGLRKNGVQCRRPQKMSRYRKRHLLKRKCNKNLINSQRKKLERRRRTCNDDEVFIPVRSLFKPFVLESKGFPSQYRKLQFSLSSDDLLQIKKKKNVQLLLRFGKLSGRRMIWDSLPKDCVVSLNSDILQTFQSPLDLVPYIGLLMDNELEVFWSGIEAHIHIVTVDLLFTRSISAYEKLLETHKKSSEDTIHKYTKLTQGVAESDVSLMSQQMSLLCPVTKLKMRIPGRGKDCAHVQCFDAVSYLEMNLFRPKWLCPLCRLMVYPEDIVIDGYWLDILRNSTSETVTIFPDGSWTFH